MDLCLQHFSRRAFHKVLHSFIITGVWLIPGKIVDLRLRRAFAWNIHFLITYDQYDQLIALNDPQAALDVKRHAFLGHTAAECA